MSLKYDLLIFDWDGTLMDSAARIVRCFRGAMQDCGLPPVADEAIARTIGLGVTDSLARLLPALSDDARRAVAARYREHFLRIDDTPTPFFSGVEEGLRDLAGRGYRLAVATGKSRVGLDAAMAATGTADLFCITRCADETASKPNPLMLHEILAQSGVDSARALMVGDTTYDVEMAAKAGVASVAVTYGVHDRAELLIHAPQACVASFPAFCAWLG